MKDFTDALLGWLRTISEIGVALVTVLLLVDILFPGSTGLVSNIKELVGEKNAEGVLVINDRVFTAVAVLLLFLLVYQRSSKPSRAS